MDYSRPLLIIFMFLISFIYKNYMPEGKGLSLTPYMSEQVDINKAYLPPISKTQIVSFSSNPTTHSPIPPPTLLSERSPATSFSFLSHTVSHKSTVYIYVYVGFVFMMMFKRSIMLIKLI